MPATIVIESVECEIEKLPDGSIRVTHPTHAFNAMNSAGTGGTMTYLVHPCQRNQYLFLNEQLPPNERTALTDVDAAPRPWWSLVAGERAGLRE